MKCVAVIIENRHIPGLEDIIRAHELMLPEDWGVWQVTDEPINTMADYNKLLTSRKFWRNMPDKVLIFQHDSMLLRPGINDFLEWDYIGAPIMSIPGCMNGGLSLRSKETMLKIIDNFPYQGESVHGNEDIYFCNRLNWVGANIPSKEIARTFSVETLFNLGSLGYHAIDKHLSKQECNAIRDQYK